FNLAKPDGGGVSLGVGWTGQWAASFKRVGGGSVNVQAGMEATHFKLHPNEEVRTPSILMVFWSGQDRMRGQNLLRSLLLAHFTPTIGGKPADPPLAASPHAVIAFEKSTEKNMLEAISNIAAHKTPFDCWWIDAGWYACENNWARWVGNPDPDLARYPNGMKPIADAAHAAGLKFLLWFEPERVMPDTWLYKNHPDWLLKPPATMLQEVLYQFNDKFHLFNLGNPEALKWLKDKVSGMIGSTGIDIYRNDFNMYPLYYWQSGEDPDRQGINEIRYVTGLYDYLDTLRREHPNLLLDNCASGGRRIDFEMLRRSVVLTRSDYLWDPIGQQSHTYGLAQWIPITGIGAADTSVYNCRSGYGSHFALAADFYSKSPEFWQSVSRTLNELKSLKNFYAGDFTPLGRYTTADNQWMAWQFDQADMGQGIVQAFRRPKSKESSTRFYPSGLDPQQTYELTNLDTKTTQTQAGSVLMEQGLEIKISDAPGSAVVTYKMLVN
ncbi:MAG: alpha-galactosidase, partial [Armatimonadota bacterium]